MIPSKFMMNPFPLTEGAQQTLEDGVEAEVSSFSFNLKEPKGIRPLVHDELF